MHARQRLDHMIPERLAGWGLLYDALLGDRPADRLPILITDSRAALEQLVRPAAEVETILDARPLPDVDPAAPQAVEWRGQWSNWLENRLGSATAPDAGAATPPAEKSAAGAQWRISLYRVAGLTPPKLLAGLSARADQPLAEPSGRSDRQTHTVACLLERSR
jgi:hypothetical protein